MGGCSSAVLEQKLLTSYHQGGTWLFEFATARVCVRAESLKSCLTLCNPVDCSLPGSSVHGILQARILEQVAISFSRGSY